MNRRHFMRLLGFATAALAVDPAGLAAPEAAVGDQRFSELVSATLYAYRPFMVDEINRAIPLIHYLRARGDRGAHALAVHIDKKLLEGGDEG